jgi:large subunit ribosomal protein L12e
MNQEVRFRVIGGVPVHAALCAPKVGPLGLNPRKLGDDISIATEYWKGIRVFVKIAVKNRQPTITVQPTVSSRIIKALREPYRKRKQGVYVTHKGDLSMRDIIKIADDVIENTTSKSRHGCVKEVLGTCVAIGCTVDGRNPTDVQKELVEMFI